MRVLTLAAVLTAGVLVLSLVMSGPPVCVVKSDGYCRLANGGVLLSDPPGMR